MPFNILDLILSFELRHSTLWGQVSNVLSSEVFTFRDGNQENLKYGYACMLLCGLFLGMNILN
jgi:hypothetical protein